MRESLKNSKRLVIKVGTSTLMYGNGHINLRTIEKLAMVLSDLRNEGKRGHSCFFWGNRCWLS